MLPLALAALVRDRGQGGRRFFGLHLQPNRSIQSGKLCQQPQILIHDRSTEWINATKERGAASLRASQRSKALRMGRPNKNKLFLFSSISFFL
jgi:hypothetical protein